MMTSSSEKKKDLQDDKTTKPPELGVSSEKIDKVIKNIDNGDIRIPAFQRGFVWKPTQIIELLDSIVKNFPIGSVLLWNTTARLKQTRNIAGYEIPQPKDEYPVNYVLDGQQRVSTIYAVFSNRTKQQKASEKYNPNLDLFEICYDFQNGAFVRKSDLKVGDNQYIELRNFLDGAQLISALKSLDPSYHDAASALYSKLINYELPVVTIKNRSKAEVGIIFERINNTGTKLTMLDLMTAWTWTDDFHLLDAIDDLLEELDEKSFGSLNKNILLQTVSGIIQADTTTPAILGLTGDQVRDSWELVRESLRKTIDFLSTQLNCGVQDFLPFQQQIPPLASFFSVPSAASGDQLSALKNWFWRTSFSDRYSTGQTTSKMNADIVVMHGIRDGKFSVVNSIKTTVDVGELISTNFSKSNPLTRAFLLLMAQSQPIDLITGSKIDLAQALSKYNRKEYHHVFPKAFVLSAGKNTDYVSSVANFCFLPSDSNKKISNKKPSDYFFTLVDKSSFENVLASNILPTEPELYQKDDFLEFLVARADEIQLRIAELTPYI